MSRSPTVNTRTGVQPYLSVESASTPSIDRLWIGEDGSLYATVSIQLDICSLEMSHTTRSTLSGTVKLDAVWSKHTN